MSRPSSSGSNSGQLEEELTLQEALLESLKGQDTSDTEDQQQRISQKIASIKQKIAKMQRPLPDWSSYNNYYGSASNSQTTDGTNGAIDPYSNFDPFATEPVNNTGISLNLPTRKRPRNAFDEEFEELQTSNKSLRTPYTASPARSVDSFATDLSDDPVLKGLFGDDFGSVKQNTERYLKDLEAKKRQEEEDAEFARQLEQQWNSMYQPAQAQASFPSKQSASTNSYGQTFLRPDGSSFQKLVTPRTEVTVKAEPSFHTDNTYRTPTVAVSGTSTPSSEDSDLVEISGNEWTNRYGSQQRTRTLPPSMRFADTFNSLSMPGSFPGQLPYISAPGTSVYGNSSYNTSQYNSSTSSLNGAFNISGYNPLSPLSNGSLPGSSRMPFNLDNYPSSLTYADPEQTQEEIKDLLKHIRPDEELTPAQLAEIQPEGLNVNLMPHQRKGFAWMKSMEEGTNKGGILADDMGLGKTVQSIALILARPPPLDDNGRRQPRPTLIVAPVALMEQWEREFKKMIVRSHRLKVLILHGGNRNTPWSEIKNHDVILTTYGLLASDLKRKDLWDKHIKMVPDAKPTPQQQCPVLGDRSKFHRIILDEAQNVKNKQTRSFAAACLIQADHRWCLSGTPMQNNVDEIFSLIKFCRIRPYNDYEKFSRDIGRPLKSKTAHYGRDKAMQQLQALLRAVLLRRTKKSKIDGQPIIQLPEKNTVEERTPFSKDEADFYKALETQAQITFNRFLKNGTVGRHYSHALVLLLRLRQCCCSPQLITNAKDFLVNGTLQDIDYIENARQLSKDVVKRLEDLEAFECPVCMDAVDNPVIFNPCGHSLCQDCLSTMVDRSLVDKESPRITCPHCRSIIDPHKTTDHQSFLRVHFPNHPALKPVDGDNENKGGDDVDGDTDSSDDEIEDESDDGKDLRDFIVPDEDGVEYDTEASEATKKKASKKSESKVDMHDIEAFESESESEFESESKSKSKLKRKKGKDSKKKGKAKKKSKPDTKTLAQLKVESLRNKAAKKKYIRRLGRGYQPSTKIEKTLQILKDIRDNGLGEKTIIFSSFTSFLDLLEVAMNRADDDFSTYTRYDGSMSAKDRNESVIRFTDDPNCRSMLVSLKAGNSGLNLTAANHVIILDPFWNPFVEYQAADRCYRIGQMREVTIHRVLIEKGETGGRQLTDALDDTYTVEDRILALQEKKRQLVETALDETASGNIGRLGTRELGFLFGVNSM